MFRPILVATLLVPAPLLAQAAPPTMSRATFESKISSEFGEMDSNKDGSLTRAEVESWQTRTASQIATARNKAIFARLDADKNGSLNAAEFARLGPAPIKANPDPLIKAMDANKDGKVTKAEHNAAGSARFTQIDANKDGVLTEAEAKAAAGK